MTLKQFRSHSADLQRSVVQSNGVFLLGRQGVGVMANLYQIEDSYVELYFDEVIL